MAKSGPVGGDSSYGGRESGCRACKASLEGLPSRRRYCKDCSGSRRKTFPTGQATCCDCSKEFDNAHGNARRCEDCRATYNTRYANRRWHELDDESRRRKMLQNRLLRFGITEPEYQALLAKQDGRCVICGTNKPNGRGDWHIDHCHKTGRVRGLLCHHCNVGLGHFRDDLTVLQRAVDYLITDRARHLDEVEVVESVEAFEVAARAVVLAAEALVL